jgi:hypothetical protein
VPDEFFRHAVVDFKIDSRVAKMIYQALCLCLAGGSQRDAFHCRVAELWCATATLKLA